MAVGRVRADEPFWRPGGGLSRRSVAGEHRPPFECFAGPSFGDGAVWIIEGPAALRQIAVAGAWQVPPDAGIAPRNPGAAGMNKVRHGERSEGGGDEAAVPSDPLFDVPGLDVSMGLRRVGGKMAFYRKLLRRFLASQGGAIHDINVALAASNFQLAARLAHAFKGCAGNIGATQLAQMAAEVDDAIREGGNGKRTKWCLMRLDVAFDAFRVRLAAMLGMPEAEGGAVLPADRVVEALAARLRRSDGEAADYFESHADVLRESYLPAEFEALATAVRHYDFAAALARIGAPPGGDDGGES